MPSYICPINVLVHHMYGDRERGQSLMGCAYYTTKSFVQRRGAPSPVMLRNHEVNIFERGDYNCLSAFVSSTHASNTPPLSFSIKT